MAVTKYRGAWNEGNIQFGHTSSLTSYVYNGQGHSLLTKYSGTAIPSNAVITNVKVILPRVSIYSAGAFNFYMTLNSNTIVNNPTWERQSAGQWSVNASTTASIYSGLGDTCQFWMGWDQAVWNGINNYIADLSYASSYDGQTNVAVAIEITWQNAVDDFTATNVTAPNATTVTITGTSGLAHTVEYTFGSHYSSKDMAAGVTTDSLTVPYDWMDAIPNSSTGVMTIKLSTISGGTVTGSKTHTVVVTCPNNGSTRPSISGINLAAENVLDSTYYAKGKTTIAPTATITAKYGSSIASRRIEINNVGYTYGDRVTLNITGQVNVDVIATDTRGFSREETVSIYVYDYSNPAITGFTAFRCDQNGSQDEYGEYASVMITDASFASVGGHNTANLYVRIKVRTATEYGVRTALTEDVAEIISGIDPGNEYDILFEIEDGLGTIGTAHLNVAAAGYLMIIRKDRKGVSFGRMPEHDYALEVPETWDYYKGNTIIND